MDDKTQADLLRQLAAKRDALAATHDALGQHSAARAYRESAEEARSIANKLDPPQPEWQNGDLVRDSDGDLWQFDGDLWWSRGDRRPTEELIEWFGPIRKVHLADPAKQEVVVSLDGINRDALDQWAKWAACEPAEEVLHPRRQGRP